MRKFNAKNLRREVQKQLKELRGGVGEQVSLATINGERLTMNDEVVVGYPLRPSGKPSTLLLGDKSPVVANDATLASSL